MGQCTWWCLMFAITLAETVSSTSDLKIFASFRRDEAKLLCEVNCFKNEASPAKEDKQEVIIVSFHFPSKDNEPVFLSINKTINCSGSSEKFHYDLQPKLKGGNYHCEVAHDSLSIPAESDRLYIPFETTLKLSTTMLTAKILAEEGVNVTCKVEPKLPSEPTIVVQYNRGALVLARNESLANESLHMLLRYVERCESIEIKCYHAWLINETSLKLPVYEELLPSSSSMTVLASDQNVSLTIRKNEDENVEVVQVNSLERNPIMFVEVRLNCTFVTPKYLYRPIKQENIYIDVVSNGVRKRSNFVVWWQNSSFHVSLDWLVFYADDSVHFECGIAPYVPKKYRVIIRNSLILHDCNNLHPYHRSLCSVNCYSNEQEVTMKLQPQLNTLTKPKDLPSTKTQADSVSSDAPCSTDRVNREISGLSVSNGEHKILAFDVALDNENNLLFDCVVFRGMSRLTGAIVRKDDECLKGDDCVAYDDANLNAFTGDKSGHLRASKIFSAVENKQLVDHIWGVHRLDNFVKVNFNISCAFQRELYFKTIKLNHTFMSSLLSIWKLFASSIVLSLLVAYTHLLPLWDYEQKISTIGTVHYIVQDKREGRLSKTAIQKIRKSEEKEKKGTDVSQRSKHEETKATWKSRVTKFVDLICPPLPHINLTVILLALIIAHIACWCLAHAGRKTDSVILSFLSIASDLATIIFLLRSSCMAYLAFKARSIHENAIERLKHCKFQ